MRSPISFAILLALAGPLLATSPPLSAQEGGSLEARVWLDRGGEEPLLRRGESVSIYYRTSHDAFAAIFRIDTDGRVSLLYPQHPAAIDVVRGGRDYRLLPPEGAMWRVEEDPGMGYLFIVASPEPLDFSLFPYDERYGWDVSAVGATVYTDPYVAIDDYVATIVPAWETVPYGLDFLAYSVGETYSYPRFLCYDCHAYQRYASWNPYDYTCVTYRVVIWDDPYFYPRYRYSGVNVVYAWPARALPRYEVTRRQVGDAVAPIVRVRTPAARQAAHAEYKESPAATPSRTATALRRPAASPPLSGSASSATASATRRPTSDGARGLAGPQERGRATTQQAPDTARSRPTLQRRPSSRLPVRTPPSSGVAPTEPAEPKSVTPAPTRTGPRAPITRPQSEPRAPQAAPLPSRTPPRAEPQARPAPSRPSVGREPQSAPPASRPSVRSTPSRGSPQPSAGAGRQPAPSTRPQAAPRSSAPSAGSGGTRSAPSRPSASPAPPRTRESPPARSSAPPRSSEPRPTVRARPAEPPSRS